MAVRFNMKSSEFGGLDLFRLDRTILPASG